MTGYDENSINAVFDRRGRIAARSIWSPDRPDVYRWQVPDKTAKDGWRDVFSRDFVADNTFRILTYEDEKGRYLALSNRGRMNVALVSVETATGKETLLSRHFA